MSFNFTDSPPDQQLFDDVAQLNNFNEALLTELAGITLSFLEASGGQGGGADATNPTEAVAAFAQTNGVNPKALKGIVSALLFFFAQSLQHNSSPNQVREDLIKLGLREGGADNVAGVWKARFAKLSSSMILKTLTANELVDMEWKFGVTAASDELAKVGSCHLQLKLVIDRGSNVRESVVMELTLSQFYEFLHQMQAASRQM